MTCKRCLGSAAGSSRDSMVACPLAAASLLSCELVHERWIQPHFVVSAAFSSERWSHSVCSSVPHTHIWSACWLPAVLPSLLKSLRSAKFMMII